ncbi:hypothetical protein niasHT_025267 [Heterodera trifolii]|uniref:DDE-1 domain-containing protein n=1 Tax=Heterodera trifolii TaxID=157864 RepID=A0ABD2KFI4_9BILA
MDAVKTVSESSTQKVCCYCKNPCSGAHQCWKCTKPCHAIAPCSFAHDAEEGFGSKVTCCVCWLDDDVDQSASAVISTEPISNQNDEALSQFITEQIVTEDNNNINDAAEYDGIFGNFHFGARLLIWDSFRCHISEDTKKTLRRLALHSAVIPGGTTKYIQAPDVCWNAPFKEAIRKLYNDWMAHGEKATTSGGNLKAPPMEVYLEWIANAWDSLPKQMIADSFLTCGISKEEKGRHDDKIHVFKPDGAIPNGLALLKQHRQEEEVLKMVEEIDLGEDESDEEIDVEVS